MEIEKDKDTERERMRKEGFERKLQGRNGKRRDEEVPAMKKKGGVNPRGVPMCFQTSFDKRRCCGQSVSIQMMRHEG